MYILHVNNRTLVNIITCVQTKLTTDTVIPDNVLDLAVGGLQKDNNTYLVQGIHISHRITGMLRIRSAFTKVGRLTTFTK